MDVTMNTSTEQKKKQLIKLGIWLLTAILLILGIIDFILLNFVFRTADDGCNITFSKNYAVCTDIQTNGPTDKAGIKKGDILLQINDKLIPSSLQSDPDIHIFLNQSAREKKYTVIYKIKRENSEISLPVKLKLTHPFNPLRFINPIIGLIFLAVGFVVVINNPLNSISIVYFIFSVIFYILLSINYLLVTPGTVAYITQVLKKFSIVLLAPVFLHFLLIFPTKNSMIKKYNFSLYAIYIIYISAFTTYMFTKSVYMWEAILLLTLIYIILGFYSFFKTSKEIKEEKLRKPIRIVRWGIILGFIPLGSMLFLTFFSGQMGVNIKIPPAAFLFMFLTITLVPLSFGYAVMKHGLMDVRVVIKRSLVYTLTTTAFVLFYIICIVGIGESLSKEIGVRSGWINAFLVGLMALAFNPAKENLQNWVDRKFYRQKYDYQKALLELSLELPMSIKLDEILAKVSSRLKETLQIQKIVITVRDADKKIFTMFNRTGVPENCDCDFVEASNGLTGILMKNKRCLSLIGADENPLLKDVSRKDIDRVRELGIELVVPMHYRDLLSGMILLGPKMSGESYSQEDMNLLSTVAGQTAVAVENARMHLDELNRHRVAEELQLAQRIQKNLLPKRAPQFPGLEVSGCSIPALEVGGDYFDYIQRGDRQLLILVGDVSGKGMPAALYMSKIQGMFQVSGTLIPSPKEMFVQVNCEITGSLERGSFITMLAVLFDLENGRALMCRAGHPPLMIKRAGCNKVEIIQSKGVGLGIVPSKRFNEKIEETLIEIHSGDFFILLSDGLTETMNANEESLDQQQLADFIESGSFDSAEELRVLLINKANEFRSGAEQNDDITLVVVKIK